MDICCTILVVDPERSTRDQLCKLLDGQGYTVAPAESAAQALDCLEREGPGLVLLELELPDMDGLELLKQLRRHHGLLQLPVLVVSTLSDSTTIVRAHDLGANDYLARPYDAQILLAKVRRQLASRQLCAPNPGFQVGSHLADYELLEVLGEGSMGRVYRARDLRCGREVALKLLLSTRLRPQDKRRFAVEAEAATRISHPNVVALYEVGETPTPYMALELVHGRPLDHPDLGGPMNPSSACLTTLGILEAVEAIHQQQVLHRDLKPGNVMLTQSGQVKVMDFGVAKLLEKHHYSDSGLHVGTPQYMAPEQIDSSFGAVSQRSDLFAVAGIFYRLLTGTDPFPANNTTEQMFAITSKEPIPPRQIQATVPTQLESICLFGLLKPPSLRYQNAREFADRLREHLRLQEPQHTLL